MPIPTPTSPVSVEQWRRGCRGDNQLQFSTCRNGRKWESGYLHLPILVLVAMLASCPGSGGQRWDGVVITHADYQGLQAFKHALVDPWGFGGAGTTPASTLAPAPGQGSSACGGRSSQSSSPDESIPSSLGRLTMLQALTFSDNRINGTKPAEIGALSMLRTLDATGNSITGPLPASLCNLSSPV